MEHRAISHTTETPTILIADDDPEIINMISEHLKDMRCNLVTAENGDKALERTIIEKPDLVILDVMMPGMSGWEVARYIRSKDEYEHTGILMLTGIGELVNEATSHLIAADDHVNKPFDFAELDFKIRRILSTRRRAEKAERELADLIEHPNKGSKGPKKPVAQAKKSPAKKTAVAKKPAPIKAKKDAPAKKAAPAKKKAAQKK